MTQKDKFGFGFWLSWILWFAGSFVLAAILWTGSLTYFFGSISEPEIVWTWCLAVFGSWFILLTPFMRKKEQIWKRLNTDQEKATDAWLAGISTFISLLIASCLFWSWKMKGLMTNGHMDSGWVKTVLATWLALTLPFLILMYRRADQIFKTAVERQTAGRLRFQTAFVEKGKRLLPKEVSEKIRLIPRTLENGHVLTVVLKDGRRIPDVFVLNSNEILGVYGRSELGFEGCDVEQVETADIFPEYEESKWLRLDGRI